MMNNTTIRFIAKALSAALVTWGGKDLFEAAGVDGAQLSDAIMVIIGLVGGVWSYIAGKRAEAKAKTAGA